MSRMQLRDLQRLTSIAAKANRIEEFALVESVGLGGTQML